MWIFIPASCSFRENDHGKSILQILGTFVDRLHTFFNIFSVQKQTVDERHPVAETGNLTHLFFCEKSGAAGSCHVAAQDIIITAVIPNVENGGILRDIFTPVYDNFRACKPKTDLKCIHDHGLGFLCPAVFLSGFIPMVKQRVHRKSESQEEKKIYDISKKTNHRDSPFNILWFYAFWDSS